MEEEPKKNHQRKNMAIKINGGGAIAGVVLLATATFLISAFAMKITRKRRSNKDTKDEGGKGLSFLRPKSFHNQSSDATRYVDVTQILNLDEKPKLESEDNSTLFDDPVIKREEIEVLADVHKAIDAAYIDNIIIEKFLESPILNIIEKEECNVGGYNVIEKREEMEMHLNEEQESAMHIGDEEIIFFANSKLESPSDGENITIEEDPQVKFIQEEQREEEFGKHIIVEKCEEDENQKSKTSEEQETLVTNNQGFFVSDELKPDMGSFETTNEVIESFCVDEKAVEDNHSILPNEQNEECDREFSVEKCDENEKIQPIEEQETLMKFDNEIEPIEVGEIAVPIQPKEQKEECGGISIMEKCEEDEEQAASANYDQENKSETCLFERHDVEIIKEDPLIELICGDQNEVEDTPSIQLSEKEQKEEYFDKEKEKEDYDGRVIAEEIVSIQEDMVTLNNTPPMQFTDEEEKESAVRVGDEEIICFVNSRREISSSNGEKNTIEKDPPVEFIQEQKEEDCDKHIIVEKFQEDDNQQTITSEGKETLVNNDQELCVSDELKPDMGAFEKHGVETTNEVIESFCVDEKAVEDNHLILPIEQKEECIREIIVEKCDENEKTLPIAEEETFMKIDKEIEPIEVDEIAVTIQPKEECGGEFIMEKCEENEKIQPVEEQETFMKIDKEIEPIEVDEIAVLIQPKEEKEECDGESIMEKCEEDKSEICLFEKHDAEIIKEDESIELICSDQNVVDYNTPSQLSEKEEYFEKEKEKEDYDGRVIAEEIVSIQEDMETLNNTPPMHFTDRFIVEETIETLPVDMVVLDDQPQMQFSENEEEDIVEIVEEDSEETGDSSMESKVEAIWPADSIQDASLLELKQLKENIEMKTKELHLLENIGNINSKGKEHHSNQDVSTKNFSERYMAMLGMQNDESTNVWKMRVWMWSILMPMWCLCYSYFGLTFLKITCIFIFVFILLNFH